MTIEIEVVALTRATELLLQAVNTRKVDLLAAVEGSLSSSQAAQAALVRVTEQTGISATNAALTAADARLTAADAASTAADKTQTALYTLAALDSLTQTNLSKQATESSAQTALAQAGIATAKADLTAADRTQTALDPAPTIHLKLAATDPSLLPRH